MDDDIDIEEHDVLDNPRIKSIFPDLSLVKIEEPDEDLDVQIIENIDDHPNQEVGEPSDLYRHDFNSPDTSDISAVHKVSFKTTYISNGMQFYGPHYDGSQSTTHTDSSDIEYDINEYQIEHAIGNYAIKNNFENSQTENDIDNYQTDDYPDSFMAVSNDEIETDLSSMDKIDSSYTNSIESDNQLDTELFNPNKIILGSKPNYDSLYEEALNTSVVVELEDWGIRLDSSPSYCNKCCILFSTVNALDAHNMVAHSFLVAVPNNIARKSTSFPVRVAVAKKSTVPTTGRLCNHCNILYPDDTALIKHLYELLPMSNFNNKIDGPTDNKILKELLDKPMKNQVFDDCASRVSDRVDTVNAKLSTKHYPRKIKCGKCSEILTLSSGVGQQAKRLAALSHTCKMADGSKRKKKYVGKLFSAPITPKSLLFQCVKCQMHFLSSYSAQQHLNMCIRGQGAYKTCNVCHRQIGRREIKRHLLQHKLSTGKFKIYIVNSMIYEKVLCKCPKCLVCFDELPFWTHVNNCTAVDFAKCRICDVNIFKKNYIIHMLKHKKYPKKDFVVVDYVYNAENAETVKTDKAVKVYSTCKITDKNPSPPKVNMKFNNLLKENVKNIPMVTGETIKNVLFYCPHCSCCQEKIAYKGHVDRSCTNWKLHKHKRMCLQCGLVISKNCFAKHHSLHEYKKFSLTDYTFINLFTKREIDPPITDIFDCHKCHVIFLRNNHLKSHRCHAVKSVTCMFCNKIYSLEAYCIHKEFHRHEILMPELMLKYNSLCSTLNIIYMCSDCDIVSTSYDSVVEHSQRHILGEADDISIQCIICNFSILQTHFKNHNHLHETNPGIDKNFFKILKYKYENLFNNNWMQLFKSLEEKDIQIILSRSIYKDVRKVKMNIIGDCDITGTIKYYCDNCKRSVDDVKRHVDSDCKNNQNYVCKYCKIKLNTVNDLVKHESKHENNTINFKIVTFKGDYDKKNNLKLDKFSYLSQSNKVSKKHIENTMNNKKFKLYCCSKCMVCTVSKHCLNSHNCILESNRRYCAQCERYFSYQNMLFHSKAHAKFPSLSKKTLSITYFGDNHNINTDELKNEADRGSAIIYKYSCGLHFTSVSLVEKHMEICRVDTCTLSRDRCSKCNLLFPTNVLVTHLCKHHSNKNVKVVVKNIVLSNLYKCAECKLVFATKKDIDEHYDKCGRDLGEKCYSCGYKFLKTYIKRHVCGENGENVYINRFNIVRKKFNQISVYKCEKCNVHYCTYKSLDSHIREGHRLVRLPITCKTCKLAFPKMSFLNHLSVHKHFKEFRIKIFPNGTKNVSFKMVIGRNKNVKDKKAALSRYRSDENDIIETTVHENVNNASNVTSNKLEKDFSLYTNEADYKPLYKCEKCSVHFCSYKSLDGHVRCGHKMSRSPVTCKMCKLVFPKLSFPRHLTLHKYCKEFKVISYGTNGMSYKMVKSRNRNDKIKDTSKFRPVIFDENDHIEATVLNNVSNLPNKTYTKLINDFSSDTDKVDHKPLHKCEKCNVHFCSYKALDNHVKCNHRMCWSPITCKMCKLVFPKVSFTRHLSLHKYCKEFKVISYRTNGKFHKIVKSRNKNDKIKDASKFRSVIIDKNDDIEATVLNNVSNVPNKTCTKLINDFSSDTDKVDHKPLHKCEKCNVHFCSYKALDSHVRCGHKMSRSPITCKMCKLVFPQLSYPRHLLLHKYCKEFKVFSYDTNGVPYEMINNTSSNEKNQDACKFRPVIFDENDHIEPTTILNNVSNESNKTCNTLRNDFRLSTNEAHSKLLYKCEKCNMHFCSHRSLDCHLKFGHRIVRLPITCEICKLTFPKLSYPRHLSVHKNRQEFRIKVISYGINGISYRMVNGRNNNVKIKDVRKFISRSLDENINNESISLDENINKESKSCDENINNESKSSDENINNETKSSDEHINNETKSSDENINNESKSLDENVNYESISSNENINKESTSLYENINNETKSSDENINNESKSLDENINYESKSSNENINNESISLDENINKGSKSCDENINNELKSSDENINNETKSLDENINYESKGSDENINNESKSLDENINYESKSSDENINNESKSTDENFSNESKSSNENINYVSKSSDENINNKMKSSDENINYESKSSDENFNNESKSSDENINYVSKSSDENINNESKSSDENINYESKCSDENINNESKSSNENNKEPNKIPIVLKNNVRLDTDGIDNKISLWNEIVFEEKVNFEVGDKSIE